MLHLRCLCWNPWFRHKRLWRTRQPFRRQEREGVVADVQRRAAGRPIAAAHAIPNFALEGLAGVLASQALPRWLARNSGPTACAATATAFVAAVVFAHGFGSATSIWALPAAFSGIALALQLAHRYASQPARAGWLAAIGCASMPIYLTHIFAMAAVRIVLMRAGITGLAVHLALGTLAGVAIPVAVYLVALRTGFAHVAGFPSWPGRDTAVRTRTA